MKDTQLKEYQSLVRISRETRTKQQTKRLQHLAGVVSCNLDAVLKEIKLIDKPTKLFRELIISSSGESPKWTVDLLYYRGHLVHSSTKIEVALKRTLQAWERIVQDWQDNDSPHGENSASYSPPLRIKPMDHCLPR